MMEFTTRVLVPGTAVGNALVLSEPLSLWGGLDPHSGAIIDKRHPQRGADVTARILVLPAGRGSSSASSILLEAVRAGHAPAAILLAEVDGILALGAAVARELYAAAPPVLQLAASNYAQIKDGDAVVVEEDGRIRLNNRQGNPA